MHPGKRKNLFMEESRHEKIALELGFGASQVRAAARLLEEGATIPFIARYRKEMTGSLDEVAVAAVRDRLQKLAELDARREAVLKSLEERNLLADDLREKISAAETLAVLEDLYLPFRPKRRTRAMIAREKGLEPLAARILAQDGGDPELEAAPFVDPAKGVGSADEALAGARDIVAEQVSEDREARDRIRRLFFDRGTVRSRVIPDRETEGAKYRDYYDWQEPVSSVPSHRLLAMRRGERENMLTLRMLPPEEEALDILEPLFVRGTGKAPEQVRTALRDGYRRLLSGSMETEVRLATKKKADETATRVFAENLRQLLLAPPLGQKSVLAFDPGFRTGCKAACLDRQGKLLHHETVYPLLSEKSRREAADRVRELCLRFDIEAIAVGNGTGGRETESFLRSLALPPGIPVIMVNESGASVYSASQAAREEFPDEDVTVRGAVSIGRRLMDPLAELVKIDPKSIGVGQYQHDVDQGDLKACLDDVVASCVNAVGVEVNTASRHLLSYVSGLGPALAENIVKHRDEQGPFRSRRELRNVPRLGPKAFEQAAGFLRIRDGLHPLDGSAVHPESYPVVEEMARDQSCSVADLLRDESRRRRIEPERYVTASVGLPTLRDILDELARPGRDPRRQFRNVAFAEGVEKIEDLAPGQKLPGVVTNITAFGAFVDVGVHQDGLVHISEMSDGFVKSPGDVVRVGQQVEVTVLAVDRERNRIALSMKKTPGAKREKPAPPEKDSRKTPPAGRRGTEPFNNPFAGAFRDLGKRK
jgi:uncharacterized protein